MLSIIADHPEETIHHIRLSLGKPYRNKDEIPKSYRNSNTLPPPKNPGWTARLVTALGMLGPSKIDKIVDFVREKFMLDRPWCPQDEAIVKSTKDNMAVLMAAKIVAFDKTAKEEIFRLSEFILDDGNNATSGTKTLAANIAKAFHHDLFLDLIDEVKEVVDVLSHQRMSLYGMEALWKENFLQDATLAQRITAAVMFQDGGGQEYVSLSMIEDFFKVCFQDMKMHAKMVNKMIAIINSLNSMGVLEGDSTQDGLRLCAVSRV